MIRTDPSIERPLPALGDRYAREYFEAWAEQRLIVQHCQDCGLWQHYPRAICQRCGATPEFEEVPAVGTVYTFTIVRQMGVEPFRSEVPYPVAMIEIDHGLKIMGNLTDCEIEDVHIGMPVEGHAVVFDGGIGIPYWRPRTEGN